MEADLQMLLRWLEEHEIKTTIHTENLAHSGTVKLDGDGVRLKDDIGMVVFLKLDSINSVSINKEDT